jgi:pimeloyl-ACP methyl ester carboxylesterase
MSTTGNQEIGQPTPAALAALITPVPTDREGYLDATMNIWKVIGSPGYPIDESELRTVLGAAYDRSYDPLGFLRQLAAITASGDRSSAICNIAAPTLVIHGEDDPLIQLSGGEATATAIQGSKLIKIPGMGHDLPPQLWPQFIDAIVENAERAGAPAGAAGS